MSRRVLSAAVAFVSATILVIAVAAGHRQRTAEADTEQTRRRAAATVKRTAIAEPNSPPASRRTKICPRGAEGLGNSARRSIKRKLLDEEGRVDRAALDEMSNLAIATGRYLERARAAPALPQRLGRTRATDKDGKPVWEAISYPTIGCAMVARPRAPLPSN